MKEKEKAAREKQNGCRRDAVYPRGLQNMKRSECDEQFDAEQRRSEQREEAAAWERKEGAERRGGKMDTKKKKKKKKKERQLREEKKEQQAMVTDEHTQRTGGDCGLFSEGWRDALQKERRRGGR